jgi:hypothetical protein
MDTFGSICQDYWTVTLTTLSRNSNLFEPIDIGHNGYNHYGTARSCTVPFIDQSEYLSSLINDPQIDGIFASLLGDDYNYLGSTVNKQLPLKLGVEPF